MKGEEQLSGSPEELSTPPVPEVNDILQLAAYCPDGFYLRSIQGFHYANPALRKLFAYRPELSFEQAGQLVNMVHQPDRKRLEVLFASDSFHAHPYMNEQFRLLMPDGNLRWFWLRQFPLMLEDGTFRQLAGILTDITLQKDQEEMIRSSEQKLLELNQTKNNLFSAISHDLRSPLNALLSFTSYILHNYENFDSFELKQVLQDLNKMTESGVSLLDNLLHWSKSQMVSSDPKYIRTELSALIHGVIDQMIPLATNKNIMLAKEKIGKAEIITDEDMFALVIRNLLSNAIKYSHRGSLVEVKTSLSNDYVEVIVADNGIGMDQETAEELLQMRVISSRPGTEQEPGTGMGLILCREFACKLGGNLRVQSWKGLGSKFIFSVPLTLPQENRHVQPLMN
ncbi:MAG: HAMP domain-containing sensor histidine kinase [Bacteroidales bacterium]